MKIAFLITAYDQPSHLYRLVKALNTQNVSFYIHLDLKYNLGEFQKFDYPPNVHFLKNRVRVTHGGFSMVQVMLNLLKTALEEENFQYFITLSGSDYPIKSNEYIENFLSHAYPMNFINFYRLEGAADWVENISKYNWVDAIGRLPRLFSKTIKVLLSIINLIPYKRHFISGMIPYRGSNWFCLNVATAAYIVNFIGTKEGKEYLRFFQHVAAPEEIFFHTLVLNSTHAVECRYYDRDIKNSTKFMKNENKAYLHYVNWGKGLRRPATLDINYFGELMKSEALFARKFNEIQSKSLLDMLDQQIK